MFIGIITGTFLGVILMAVCASNRIGDLEREMNSAEKRALTHFRKLNEIEKILKNSDKKKENYFITLDKIKRELVKDYQSRN